LEEILKFQLHKWYEVIHRDKSLCVRTFKTEIIEVTTDFVERFMLSDGIFLPDKLEPELLTDRYLEEVKTLTERIQALLHAPKNTDRGLLARMNWSSSQDALFMCESLACFTPEEVFLQLKASTRVTDDISRGPYPEENAPDFDRSKVDKWTIVLRRCHTGYNKGMEFRAFISKGKFIGIC